jgi:hypothetical protein
VASELVASELVASELVASELVASELGASESGDLGSGTSETSEFWALGAEDADPGEDGIEGSVTWAAPPARPPSAP